MVAHSPFLRYKLHRRPLDLPLLLWREDVCPLACCYVGVAGYVLTGNERYHVDFDYDFRKGYCCCAVVIGSSLSATECGLV